MGTTFSSISRTNNASVQCKCLVDSENGIMCFISGICYSVCSSPMSVNRNTLFFLQNHLSYLFHSICKISVIYRQSVTSNIDFIDQSWKIKDANASIVANSLSESPVMPIKIKYYFSYKGQNILLIINAVEKLWFLFFLIL